MKFIKFKELVLFMTALFTSSGKLEELFDKDGKLVLSDEMDQRLAKELGPKSDIAKIKAGIEEEYAELQKANAAKDDPDLKALREEARKALLRDHSLSEEEADELLKNPENASTLTEKEILQNLTNKLEEQDKQIKKLLKDPEVDSPEALLKKGAAAMRHSSTHIFGSGKQYDAFENRPWNQRAAGLIDKPTVYAADSTEIQTLKGDIDLYYRENPTKVNSLFRDKTGLPSFWNTRTDVDDRVADGNIVSAEISQARKKGWLPKNRQLIQPEEDMIYPIQVDIEHAGYELQKIEASWLNMMNKEGSQPFKMNFVMFLLTELDKRARQEDRIQATKGVHVKTPDDATIAGLSIHRGDGIFIKLWRALYKDNKYKVALLGTPTPDNIVDYVKNFIEKNIPEEERNNAGIVLYMSKSLVRWHVERKRVLFGQDNNYTGQELLEIENYPNIKFCPLHDLEGTLFMFATYDDNIELLEKIPREKSMYSFDKHKRDLYIMCDYKFGSRLKHIGTKVKDTDPAAFKVQTVWTNGLSPFKSDFFVRLYDDATGEITLPYSNITVTDDWATNIDTINGTYANQIVRIKGNTGAAGNVTDEGNITLAGAADWSIASGGTLTLRVEADLTLTEIKRTVAPAAEPDEVVNFAGTSFDADEGYTFNYTGGAASLTQITNGIEGQTIQITNSGTGALTINDIADNVDVTAAAVVAAGDDISFTKIDGVWVEIERNIAP